MKIIFYPFNHLLDHAFSKALDYNAIDLIKNDYPLLDEIIINEKFIKALSKYLKASLMIEGALGERWIYISTNPAIYSFTNNNIFKASDEVEMSKAINVCKFRIEDHPGRNRVTWIDNVSFDITMATMLKSVPDSELSKNIKSTYLFNEELDPGIETSGAMTKNILTSAQLSLRTMLIL
jgi:hypothetical protein